MDGATLVWIALLMALFALSPGVMKPTALVLNLIVAGFAAFRYVRAGQVNFRLLAAFAATAIPMAFVGGMIHLPGEIYRPVVGVLLWAAALRLFWSPGQLAERTPTPPALWISLPAGALLGLLAGLTGTGGGIFLSPLILLFGWEAPRRTSGVAAVFIVCNSLAGLAGDWTGLKSLPPELPVLAAAVGAGALIGTWLGVSRLPQRRLLQALGLVLLAAGVKLVFT